MFFTVLSEEVSNSINFRNSAVQENNKLFSIMVQKGFLLWDWTRLPPRPIALHGPIESDYFLAPSTVRKQTAGIILSFLNSIPRLHLV